MKEVGTISSQKFFLYTHKPTAVSSRTVGSCDIYMSLELMSTH